jgi:hypothetical protein
MSRGSPIEHAARHFLRRRVLSSAILCVVVFWFLSMTGTYRLPNRYLALSVLAAAIFLAVSLVILAKRVVCWEPSANARSVVETLERCAPLIVLNLIVVSMLAPVLPTLALLQAKAGVLRVWLMILGSLSAKALFVLLLIAAGSLIALAVVHTLDWILGRRQALQRVGQLAERAALTVVLLYCLYAMALTFNGSLDSSPAKEYRAEIVQVWGIPLSPLWWADVSSWESPGQIKRVLIFPEHDGLRPELVGPGQAVRLRIRSGAFGLDWVESMRVDFERQLEALVAAAPSAAIPRRMLVEALLRARRWEAVVEHTKMYVHYYPQDRQFVERVTAALRAAGRSDVLAALAGR